MPPTITPFDVNLHHIHVDFFVTDPFGIKRSFEGIIDTGAPRTEFSDIFLVDLGFLKAARGIQIKQGLQTQKYGKFVLPVIEICGCLMENFEIMVSRFDKSWGIAALIGLDFFKRFRVTIDYKSGHLVTEPL